jgi:hypothetical protein
MAIEVSQTGFEVLRTNDANPARVTQVPVEVLRQADATAGRVTHVPVEVLRVQVIPQSSFLTQVGVEVARAFPPSEGQLTQVGVEVARRHVPGPQPGLPSWMVFDNDHTITVTMVSGEPLTSALNDLEVYNGANVALLGQEIIQFRDVTDLGDNRYQLSRLLRGRLGTELFMNSHSVGDTFVILDSDSVRRATQAITDLNVQRYFKVVGFGLPSFGAPITPFINTGVSQKPWQPVFIRGTRDGSNNLTITWTPRSRINNEWLDLIDTPISEMSERYEVDIINSAGAPTASSPIEVTSPQASYSAALQTSELGGVQSAISVVVYQLSNVVGRGYGGRAVV